jgi:polar amino acid transport system permease protein
VLFDWILAVEILPLLLQASIVTIEATIGGFLLAFCLGLAFEVARRLMPRVVAYSVEGLIQFVRGTPLLVQLYFAYFLLPELGIFMPPLLTGILVLGLHYACYLAEVFRAGLAAVPKGQWEGASALGLDRIATFRLIVLPQAIPPMIPPLGNYLIVMFKETPLLSAITIVELMTRAKLIGSEYYSYMEPITLVGLIFLVLSMVAASGIRVLERRLRIPGRTG